MPEGTPAVTRRQIGCFVGAIALLWTASDWPIHDIGEEHLYSVHMLQHMMLSYFMPPLALLATPTWLARLLIGDGRLYSAMRWMTKPVVAAVVFNTAVMVTHVPGVVNAAVQHGPLHYALHAGVVLTSLLMWMPVVGPLPEVRIGPAGQMVYLFAQSVVPTVPAGWLTFADGVVYKVYDHAPRGLRADGHLRPATGRGHHESRRLGVPLDDHHGALLQEVHAQLGGAELLHPTSARA